MSNLANKDSAIVCKDNGKEALLKGDYDRAIRMFEKSMRLYPVTGVKEMKERAEREKLAAAQKASEPRRRASTSGSGGTAPPGRPNSSSRAAAEPAAAPQRAFTPAQDQLAKEICQKAKDKRSGYYKVLNVDRRASEDEIKRAYKKLALKLHPDKNTAPSAENAFKMVSMAYSTLTDAEKRAHYDAYGVDDPTSGNDGPAGGGGGMRRRQHTDPNDINPEDIFNMFFGGVGGPGMRAGGPGFRVYQHNMGGQRQGGQGGGDQGQAFQLMQLAPLILLFLMSFFSYPAGNAEPAFSLQRTGAYLHKRQTQSRGVRSNIQYYVKEGFARQYARDRYSLSNVEVQVQQTFHDELRYECQVQTQQQRRMRTKARQMRSKTEKEELLARADEMELSGCAEYNQWFRQ